MLWRQATHPNSFFSSEQRLTDIQPRISAQIRDRALSGAFSSNLRRCIQK